MSRNLSWFLLLLAGMFEVGWVIGLKYSAGFTRLWPSIGTGAAMVVSVALLGIAMKSLPVGVAYAVWVGIGAAGAVLAGIVLFGEAVTMFRSISVLLILAGVAGLKFASA